MKGIDSEQLIAEVVETLSEMSYTQKEEFLRRIYQMSMPEFLPLIVKETARQQFPAATPTMPIATSSWEKTASITRKRRPIWTDQETYQQRRSGRLITANPAEPAAATMTVKKMMASI